jgi:hypothetical protein
MNLRVFGTEDGGFSANPVCIHRLDGFIQSKLCYLRSEEYLIGLTTAASRTTFWVNLMWITYQCKASLLGLLFGLVALHGANAQNACAYQVITSGDYSPSVLHAALDQAKLDSYRKRTQPRVLQFDQNARVLIFSAMNLSSRGCPVDERLAMPDNTPIDEHRVFTIHPTGVIMETVSRPVKQ